MTVLAAGGAGCPRRDGGPSAFRADAEKVKTLLGWQAAHAVEDMGRNA